MVLNILPLVFFFFSPALSFVQFYTCSFSLSKLRTSSSYITILLRHFNQAAVSIKTSNLLICFCSFELSWTVLEKDNSIDNLYIVLYCVIKERVFFFSFFFFFS